MSRRQVDINKVSPGWCSRCEGDGHEPTAEGCYGKKCERCSGSGIEPKQKDVI